MKKQTSFLLAIIVCILIVFACTNKEIRLITNVELEFTQTTMDNGVVNELIPSTFVITPEAFLPEFVYYFHYEIVEGEGVFMNEDQEEVPSNETIILLREENRDNFILNFDYRPTISGLHRVKVTASDNFDKSFSVILTYRIEDLDILWAATTDVTTVELGEIVPVQLTLQNNSEDPDATFQRRYSFAQGTGILQEVEGAAIVMNEFVPIIEGAYPMHVIASELGTTTVNFMLRDSNGQELITSTTFEVTLEVLSNKAEILTLSINGIAGVITENTITVTLPESTEITSLTPEITISEGASISPETTTPQDFSQAVNYTITAEGGITTQEYSVTVVLEDTTVPITAVTITQESLNLVEKTDPQQLTVTVTPDNATNQNVVWTSQNTDVASVGTDGTVTPGDVGTTVIRATSVEDAAIFDEITVTVVAATIPIIAINIAPESQIITVGDTSQLTVELLPENTTQQQIVWSSSDITIATVDGNGVVTAIRSGNVVITATSQENDAISDTAEIIVEAPIILATAIAVTPETVNLIENASLALTVSLTPDEVTNQNVIWTSNDEAIATMSNEGVVTAISVGNTIIRATWQDDASIFVEIPVTIVAATIPITAMNISPASQTITLGDTSQLAVALQPENTTQQQITWGSSDESIATVDENGLVTPIAVGETVITTTSQDNPSVSDQITVTVVAPLSDAKDITGFSLPGQVTGGGINPTLKTVGIPVYEGNDITNVTPTITISPGASISPTGPQDFTNPVIYTVTAADGSTQDWTVTVNVVVVEVTAISITPENLSLTEGDPAESLTVTYSPGNTTQAGITWDSGNPAVASVSSTGQVTPIAAGETVIKATSQNNAAISDQITVTVVAPLSDAKEITATHFPGMISSETIDVTSKTVEVSVNDGTQIVGIEPTIIISDGASISPTGPQDFTNPVVYTITAEDGTTQDWIYTVNRIVVEVTGINVTPTSLTLTEGDPGTSLTITYIPGNTTQKGIIWSSSNPSIATVDNNGLVKPVASGNAIITARSDQNTMISDTVDVTVAPSIIPVTGITVTPESITMAEGHQQTLMATVIPANATNQNVTWTSSNETVAVVDNLGVITALGLGTATITATTESGGFTDATTINVVEPYLDFETGAFYGPPGERIYNQITGGGGVSITVSVRTAPNDLGEYLGGDDVLWGSMSGGCVPFDFIMPDSGVVYIRASAFDSNQNGSAGININTGVATDPMTPGTCAGNGMGAENIPLSLSGFGSNTRVFPE